MRATVGDADKGGAGGRNTWPYFETVASVSAASVGIIWFALWRQYDGPGGAMYALIGAFWFAYGAWFFLRATRIARGDSRALRVGRFACGAAMTLIAAAHIVVLLAT